MDRLNYFNPYQGKSAHHEDRLTRSFMTLMRYSTSVSHVFYSYCYDVYLSSRNPDDRLLPPLSELIQSNWTYGTQKTNPIIETDLLLSILITDEGFRTKNEVTQAKRKARYDGLVVYGNSLSSVIEVKPRVQNVYEGQLAPSGMNLSKETTVLSKPVVLEWKNIIKQLNGLMENVPMSAQENMMIHDFLDFVDSEFPFLNPYDRFSLCKSHASLLRRRIDNILKTIVVDSDKVDYHRSWGNIIRVQFSEIFEIGLILKFNQAKESWRLELCLFFGDTVGQARPFYKRDIKLDHLDNEGWDVRGNSHVSFRSQNLVWFQSSDIQKYINYWKNNPKEIRQYKREEIEEQLIRWDGLGLLTYNDKAKEDMQESFFKTKMTTINFSPAVALIYRIEAQDAIELDDQGTLTTLVRDKILEAFSIIGYGQKELKGVLKFE